MKAHPDETFILLTIWRNDKPLCLEMSFYFFSKKEIRTALTATQSKNETHLTFLRKISSSITKMDFIYFIVVNFSFSHYNTTAKYTNDSASNWIILWENKANHFIKRLSLEITFGLSSRWGKKRHLLHHHTCGALG